MAGTQDTANAKLDRFRQAKAIQYGLLAEPIDRRPKVVTGVTSLRLCERWRSDVIRDLNRKVSKIQDFGLNEYEIRDLNDEINDLFREKLMWEKHIVALGGANYTVSSRNADTGDEIPGTRGYKYFGRAKELPGVKEMFSRTAAQQEELESYRSQKFRRFQNQSGAYFGNEDEVDGQLLPEESACEKRGWEAGWERIAAALELPQDTTFPPIPRSEPAPLSLQPVRTTDTPTDGITPNLNALDAQELAMPEVPDRKAIESFLLKAKKAALRSECTYGRLIRSR